MVQRPLTFVVREIVLEVLWPQRSSTIVSSTKMVECLIENALCGEQRGVMIE